MIISLLFPLERQSKYGNYTWYAYKIKTGEIMKCSIENLTIDYVKPVQKNKNWSTVKKDSIQIKNNFKGRVYLKAVDKAGNEKIIKTVGFNLKIPKLKNN